MELCRVSAREADSDVALPLLVIKVEAGLGGREVAKCQRYGIF